jgi:putative hydrolase of the HAD superfamily
VSAVRGVLLDIDDTLVDTRSAFRSAVRQVQRRWLPHLDDSGTGQLLARWQSDPGGHFRAFARGECDFGTQRRRRAEDLHAFFGGPALDEESFACWERDYEQAFRAAWVLCGDAVAFLDGLVAARLPIGAVTNAVGQYQRDKLARLGLADRFGVLVGVDELGRGKPDPEVFALACYRLGFPAGECAFVGDELDVDARGARDAGLFGIWLDRHRSGLTPDDVPVARTLADVPVLLGLPGVT